MDWMVVGTRVVVIGAQSGEGLELPMIVSVQTVTASPDHGSS
jgi:hypothetical protein